MSDNGVQVPQSQGEKLSFRASVKAEVCKLRRIQLICLPTIVLAVIGTMFIWGIGTMSSVLWTVIRVIMFVAVLGEFYCFFKARKLTCPKCHKRVAYLLHDPYYSKVTVPCCCRKACRQTCINARIAMQIGNMQNRIPSMKNLLPKIFFWNVSVR